MDLFESQNERGEFFHVTATLPGQISQFISKTLRNPIGLFLLSKPEAGRTFFFPSYFSSLFISVVGRNTTPNDDRFMCLVITVAL